MLLGLLSGCGPHSPEPRATPQPPTIVTLGDSVPAGTGCTCAAFPELYARHEHAVSINLAAPGLTSADVRAELRLPAVRDSLLQADEVVIMIGANDVADSFTDDDAVASGARTIRTNVRATIDGIQQLHHTLVIVLGYWNVVRDGRVGVTTYGEKGVEVSTRATGTVNDALAAAADDGGAVYLSTEPAFHGLDGSQDPTALLIADGDHPNSAGHNAIARLLPPVSRS
ncbi:SGNH/GDSL hydrolase family protein [Actinoplanes sp. NPDC049548]|uniref:SGNH/GDSL hydrolase family protein n=1 Tax=Actinoplanes sp. NPDC049548 TaxID=3155152 RepID=UPI003434521B